MGEIILAKCEYGFEEHIFADRGKVVSGKTCIAPALCESCNKLLSLNYAEKNLKCPECKEEITFYNDNTLQKKNLKADLINWGMDLEEDFVLPKADFKCPSCSNFNLKFMKVGNRD